MVVFGRLNVLHQLKRGSSVAQILARYEFSINLDIAGCFLHLIFSLLVPRMVVFGRLNVLHQLKKGSSVAKILARYEFSMKFGKNGCFLHLIWLCWCLEWSCLVV